MAKHTGIGPREKDKTNDFEAVSELEDVVAEVVRIEALLTAALNCFENLPRGEAPQQRKAQGRLYALVSTAADVAEAAHEERRQRVNRLAEGVRGRGRAELKLSERVVTEPNSRRRGKPKRQP